MTALQLLVKIGADTKDFEKKVAGVESTLKGMGDRLSSTGLKLSAALTLPLGLITGSVLKLGMNAVESENLFSVSFGEMADAAREWSVETSKALGLNEYELRKTTGMFFTMFEAMGLGKDASFGLSTELVKLAQDMASFYNLSPEVAFEKLRAGISGEAEPLKQLGILVDETTVKSMAMKDGLIKVGEEMSQQQKVVARFNAIMAQTSKAQGDLARTMDSPANQLRRLKTEFEQAATKIGMALMPALQGLLTGLMGLVPYLQRAAEWFGNTSPRVQMLIVGMVGLLAALGPVLIMLGTMVNGLSALVRVGGSTYTFLVNLATRLLGVGVAGQTAGTGAAAAGVGARAAGTGAAAATPSVTGFGVALGFVARALSVLAAGFAGWQIGNFLKTMEVGKIQLQDWVGIGAAWVMQGGKVSIENLKLEATSRRAAEAASQQGQASAEVTQVQKEAESVMEKLKGVMAGLTDNTKAQAKADKEAAEEHRKLKAQWSGSEMFTEAGKIVRVIGEIGGVTKLTKDEAEAYNRVLEQVIEKAKVMKIELPAAFHAAAAATRPAIERGRNYVQEVFDAFRYGEPAMAVPDIRKWAPSSVEFERMLDNTMPETVTGLPEFLLKPKSGGSALKLAPDFFLGFGKMVKEQLGPTILQALTGGGDVVKSVGGLLGGGLGESIATRAGGFLTKNLGKTLGGALGSVIPGLGTILGSLGGGLFDKLFGGLFGPSKGKVEGQKADAEIESLKKGLLDTYGSLENIRKAGGAAGAALADAWGSKNVAGLSHFKGLLDKFNAAVKATSEEAASWDRMKEAADRYGISLDALGSRWHGEMISRGAQQLVADFELLTSHGADAGAVLAGMSDEVSQLVNQSIKFGTELPAALRPIIEQLIESGQLLDENGNKISDLGSINFAEPISKGFDRVVEAVDRLSVALGATLPEGLQRGLKGIDGAIAGYTPPGIEIPVNFRMGDVPTGGDIELNGLASGGVVRRPGVFMVGEAGPEAVVPLNRLGGLMQPTSTEVVLNVDGYTLARQLVRHTPRALQSAGV